MSCKSCKLCKLSDWSERRVIGKRIVLNHVMFNYRKWSVLLLRLDIKIVKVQFEISTKSALSFWSLANYCDANSVSRNLSHSASVSAQTKAKRKRKTFSGVISHRRNLRLTNTIEGEVINKRRRQFRHLWIYDFPRRSAVWCSQNNLIKLRPCCWYCELVRL